MSKQTETTLCVAGLAYFEAYVPNGQQAPVPGTEEFVQEISLSVGGALNTAVVANALGCNCTIACPLGNGLADAAVRFRLTTPDGLHNLTWPGPDNPAVSLVFGDSEDRAFVSKAAWSALKDCPDLSSFDWIHVPGLPEAKHLETQLRDAAQAGTKVSLSASWHPELLHELKQRSDSFWDVVFLNELEADPNEEAEDELQAFSKCAKNIVLTKGKAGARALFDGQLFNSPSQHADAVNVTGAGDAFAAGFVCALLEQQSPQTALDWASKAAAFYISLNDEKRFKLSSANRSQILG